MTGWRAYGHPPDEIKCSDPDCDQCYPFEHWPLACTLAIIFAGWALVALPLALILWVNR